MTIAILTLILLSYMKITGKTLPAVERRLNKVKNAKKKNVVTDITTIADKDVLPKDISKIERVPFKQKNMPLYPKTFSGSLKI